MVVMKIVLAAVAIVVVMVVAQDRHWAQRTGVVGTCTTTNAPRSSPGGVWYACKQGLLNGYPSLEADNCTIVGDAGKREYWQCEAPLRSVPGA
jgi:hypothetical protein